MTSDERKATIANVISDLQAILDSCEKEGREVTLGDFLDAKLACEYIMEDEVHL